MQRPSSVQIWAVAIILVQVLLTLALSHNETSSNADNLTALGDTFHMLVNDGIRQITKTYPLIVMWNVASDPVPPLLTSSNPEDFRQIRVTAMHYDSKRFFATDNYGTGGQPVWKPVKEQNHPSVTDLKEFEVWTWYKKDLSLAPRFEILARAGYRGIAFAKITLLQFEKPPVQSMNDELQFAFSDADGLSKSVFFVGLDSGKVFITQPRDGIEGIGLEGNVTMIDTA